MTDRRTFVKKISAAGGAFMLAGTSILQDEQQTTSGDKPITLEKSHFSPLDPITIRCQQPGRITVRDGQGNIYFSQDSGDNFQFWVGGCLGYHSVSLANKKGQLLDYATFNVNGKTHINDEGAGYGKLLDTLFWSMTKGWGYVDMFRVNGRFYETFVRWLRDHVHTMKGLKYFYPNLKSGIDLYADTQRGDGMIWDNIYPRYCDKNWWDRRFAYADFIEHIENGHYEMKRIPVENDVEYLFIEGLYYTWKATGDDDWMAGHLDKALKAVHYSTTSPYRWSDKYQLLKRGFTIDTWDFQSNEDTALMDGNDIMRIELGKTRFGIMYGDNTGMAQSCLYLAEMLEYAGRHDEAADYRKLSGALMDRLNALSWNGRYYTHHVPEDPSLHLDLGVDQLKQVSLSNAYSINRTLTHEQCVAIIKTYQQIRQEIPESSPGEWYTIYPPFEGGFGNRDSSSKWEYMNGGVTSIVAGELAHGAFEHGFESYGADILQRVAKLARETDDYLHCTYRGAVPEKPERRFDQLNITGVANSNFPGKEAMHNDTFVWSESIYHDIPFAVLNPDEHQHTAIELNNDTGLKSVISPVGQQAASVYLLHTSQSPMTGTIKLIYDDKTYYTDYITQDKSGHWWTCEQTNGDDYPNSKLAWRSNNDQYVAFYVYGFNNPYPDKIISDIHFDKAENDSSWKIRAITLCSASVFFMPDIVSFGIPDNWGAAAVVYALVEGLAGIKDNGVAYNKAVIAPRWEAAGVSKARAVVKYEASEGYVAYEYEKTDPYILFRFTGTPKETELKILLPQNSSLKTSELDGHPVDLDITRIENSQYARLLLKGVGVHQLRLTMIN